MKYSTIEACFSVPMLNLTIPSFPFVVAFAVKALGWHAEAIGWMAALPHICNFIQPFLLSGVSRRFSNFDLLVLMFSLGALPWGLAAFLPVLGGYQNVMFTMMLVVGTLASSVASVAWSAAISEVVPERVSGRYFARRNLIFGGWTLVMVMIAGHVVDIPTNPLPAFSAVFCAAGISRLLGLFFLTRMQFPPSVMQPLKRGIAARELIGVLHDNNYRNLCIFIGAWGLLLNGAMPFYTMFLINRLNLSVGTIVILTTLSSLGGLVTLKNWGRLSDRFGNRPLLQVAALIWALTALGMWSMSEPGWTIPLFIGYFIVGAMTAGFQLTQFNLMLRLAPQQSRGAYVAVFLALTSLFTAIGPILGGQFLKSMPSQIGTLFGRPVSSFHLLFVCAALGCALVINLIQRVREPSEQPVINVWREMRTMRGFNPMLSVLSVGELLLTPRGLLALTRRSLRSVRQQVKALEDVGEEIASGGKELLKKVPKN